ncbi:MAG: protein kinase [Syntrophomonadaceae bacterium]|nr:protein kinase [Syntrophomonadaceae bacterium]
MLKIGEFVFGKYRIIDLLGKGGMGSVYLAENINVGNKWAIKEIVVSQSRPIDLMVEPEVLKRLNHVHLPRIVDVVRTPDSICIIEDYFEGRNLQQVLENRKLSSETNVVRWSRQLAEILIYLHNLKPVPIIYSDLKPGNIIIDTNLNLKLVDFGISRESSGSSGQGVFGSRGYAAPEQYAGIFDERTDIYSFGATFYHVLTGHRYDSKSPYGLRDYSKQFSEGIDHIIGKCLQEDPDKRYQNAVDLYKDLKFINQFNSDYKQGVLKQKLAVAGIIGIILIGSLTLMLGINRKEETTVKLYQEKIDAGIQLTSEGKYHAAELAFKEALNYKSAPEVYKNLGRLYLRENKASQAVDFLKEKIQSGTILNDASTAYLLGSAYYDLQDYNNAISYFKQSLQTSADIRGEDYELTMRDLAVSYCHIDKYAEANEILEELEQNKGSTSAVTNYIRGEVSLAKGDMLEASRYFEQARSGERNNIEYILGIGRLYTEWSAVSSTNNDKISKLKIAQEIIKEGEKIDPYHIQILTDYGRYSFELGQLYESIGDNASNTAFQQARLAFTKLKDIDSEDSNTHLNLAIVYDKLDDYQGAESSFQESLRLEAGSSHINFIYGLFKLKHKQYETAYQYLQKTVDLNKDSYEVSVARSKINEIKEKGWI